MNISWFGQSCFRIEAKEGSVLVDPFSKDIGLKPPRVRDDLVLVTHDHYDHNAVGDAEAAFVIRGPGEYERKGISVRGILSYHDDTGGAERGLNTIYVIRAEEMTVCHLGDLGQKGLTEAQLQDIGDVDVLLVPVGGTYTLDAKEAAHVVSQIEPKVVVPMHYETPGLNIALDGPEKFIKEVGLDATRTDKLKLAKKTLPVDEMQVFVITV